MKKGGEAVHLEDVGDDVARSLEAGEGHEGGQLDDANGRLGKVGGRGLEGDQMVHQTFGQSRGNILQHLQLLVGNFHRYESGF